MSQHSEIAEMWNEHKAVVKERKIHRLAAACPNGWSKHTEYHWYRMIKGKKMDYWPSSGLVMFRGKRMNINSKAVKKLLGIEL